MPVLGAGHRSDVARHDLWQGCVPVTWLRGGAAVQLRLHLHHGACVLAKGHVATAHLVGPACGCFGAGGHEGNTHVPHGAVPSIQRRLKPLHTVPLEHREGGMGVAVLRYPGSTRPCPSQREIVPRKEG